MSELSPLLVLTQEDVDDVRKEARAVTYQNEPSDVLRKVGSNVTLRGVHGLLNEIDAQRAACTALRQQLAEAQQERDELAQWKANEQRFLIAASVELLEAGYRGDGVLEGIKFLVARLSALTQERDALKAGYERPYEVTYPTELAVSPRMASPDHSCKCPAQPGEDCPLSPMECYKRALESFVAEAARDTRTPEGQAND